MEKVKMVITRRRWKAKYFNNNNITDNNKEKNTEWYGIKLPYIPIQLKELISLKMIQWN